MEEDGKKEKQSVFFTPQNIVTLIIGIFSITVSLFIYLSSQKSTSLQIEQFNPITYATTEQVTAIQQFEIIVNGERINNLISIPFKISNTGEEPISSVGNSKLVNLLEPIKLKLDFGTNNLAKIIAIQNTVDTTNLKLKYTKSSNNTFIMEISLAYLNPKNELSFSVLINSKSIPTLGIINNPLIGGNIEFYQNSRVVVKDDLWYQFKHIYFLNIVSILFIAQFIFVLIYLIYQARILYLDNKKRSNEKGLFNIDDKERNIQQEKITNRIDEMINNQVTDTSLTNSLKNLQLSIPKGGLFDNKGIAYMSIYDLLKKSYKDEWNWELEKEFPLSNTDENTFGKSYYPAWIDWEDYLKFGILSLGLISLAIGILGYFLYFH